ncbi:MAG: hypothetical protein LBS59_02570 [Puniceicoccales bacterium]|nr:hypothetical protein [Puniceicoccales bacterium]
MRHFFFSPAILFAAALVVAPGVAQSADIDPAKTEQVRAKLAGLSDSGRTQLTKSAVKIAGDSSRSNAERVAAIRSLALLQNPSSVAALKALFSNSALADDARAAVQLIPGNDATAALLEGLAKVNDPKLRAGFIESLGVRRAPEAVNAIKAYIGSPVSEAALRAIATIATPDAFSALNAAPASELKSDLIIDVAAKLLECPKCSAKVRSDVLGALRKLSGDTADKDAAFSAYLLRFRFQDADPALALKSPNSLERRAAGVFLNSSRDVESGKLLEKALATAKGEDINTILGAFENRKQVSAAPAVRARAEKEKDPLIKATLIKTLSRIGGANDIAFFSKLTQDSEPLISDAAKSALGQVRGKGVTDAFTNIIRDTRAKVGERSALIDIIIRRQLRDAVPALIPVLSDTEEDIRIGALKVIERYATKAQLKQLEKATPTDKTVRNRLAKVVEKLKR